MKAQMLKIAGVKSEAAFYKKFPTQEAFMKVHGKEFKKAQAGASYPNLMNNFQANPVIPQLTPAGMSQALGATSIANVPKFNIPASAGNQPAKGPGAAQIIGAASGIIDAAGAFKQQKNKLKGLKQDTQLTALNRKAANSVDVDINSQREASYVRPEDMITTGNQINPAGGVGGSVLSKNGKKISKKTFEVGGEIQNTYAPGTLYDDLEYEPLNDSDQVKQFARGGYIPKMAGGGFTDFMGAGGTDFATKAVGSAFGNNAGSQMGAAVGNAVKIIPGVGPVAGAIAAPVLGAIGGLADNVFGDAGKIKKQQGALDRENNAMQGEATGRAINEQFSSFKKNGGYVSHDWTPQLITKFGDHSPEDVYDFAHEGMDSLRAGGHLKSYREPSEEAMGGNVDNFNLGGVNVESGGYLEPISYNPFNDGTGITSMIKGQSHDDYDSELQHSGVILNAYGNKVEAEGGEPIREVKEGGELGNDESAVITGNLVYKNINNMFDPKYNKYQGKKIKNIHNEIALKDKKLNKLEEKNTNELLELNPKNATDKLKLSALEANKLGYEMQYANNAIDADYFTNHQTIINDTAAEHGLVADALAKGKAIQDKEAMKQQAKNGKMLKAQYGKGRLSKERLDRYNIDFESLKPETEPALQSVESANGKPASDPEEKASGLKPWQTMLLNEIIQRTRPSDVEGLDQDQLLGEMYAMATNQLEPVQAQKYNPQLQDPNSRISLQDKINDITAQSRASQRMLGYNPAAQAIVDAQAYQALDKVRGEEFRLNQDRFDKRSAENIATLNDAQIKNLGILDQQYQRQAEAKSNTKATTLAALNSISDKYAKNRLENRQLQTYENLYNYRYDDKGRLVNMNPLAQFNTNGLLTSSDKKKSQSGEDLLPVYDKEGDVVSYKVKQEPKSKTSRNGSIVRSLKNI